MDYIVSISENQNGSYYAECNTAYDEEGRIRLLHNEVGFSFNQMHFDHKNSSLVCSDGQLVKAYVAPIDGGWGSNIPIGSEAIITVG